MKEHIINTNGFNQISLTRDGWFIYNRNDSYIGKSIEYYGEYSIKEKLLLNQVLHNGDSVIEVGANIGALTIPISKMIGDKGKIYAIEPIRISFQTLCGNVSINSCTNAYCYQYGISDKKQTLKTKAINHNSILNYGNIEIEKLPEGNEIIEVTTLDNLLFKEIENLRLIKIDVEGMEIEVIWGADKIIKRFRPILYVENDRERKSRSLIEAIKSLNYKLFWHASPYYNKNNFAKEKRNLFVGEGSINMLCIPKEMPNVIHGIEEITDSHTHPLFK